MEQAVRRHEAHRRQSVEVLNSGMNEIDAANTTKPSTLELVELRTLKHRMLGRLNERAY